MQNTRISLEDANRKVTEIYLVWKLEEYAISNYFNTDTL